MKNAPPPEDELFVHRRAREIATEIDMLRLDAPGALIVLVEGDTDARLFRGYLLDPACIVHAAGSRANALGAIAIINQGEGADVIAIVDADFDRFEGRTPPAPNIFWADGHDVEVMILQTDALARVLSEQASPKVARLAGSKDLAQQTSWVRGRLFQNGRTIGGLRLYSQGEEGPGLAFGDLDLTDKALWIKDVWTLDTKKVINRVRSQNPGKRHRDGSAVSNESLEVATRPILARTDADADLCRGHDLTAILVYGLTTHLANAKGLTPEDIERELRLAFDRDCFATTTLHAALLAWSQAQHPPRHLLR